MSLLSELKAGHAETLARARSSGLIIALSAAVLVPAWAGFDVLLAPHQAHNFIIIRSVCDIPVLGLLATLAWHPVGRHRPQLLTFAVLAVVQAEIAWMVVRVDAHRDAYVMGFSLALFASGCLIGGEPRWTAAVVATTWAALGVALIVAPRPVPPKDLMSACFYLSTASVIAVIAHVQRSRLTNRELVARRRLEREQRQTRQLLNQLHQLSNQDYLTGVANRRRWDSEVQQLCHKARKGGLPLAVLVIDIDRFKDINDRDGHAVGDQTLQLVASFLAAHVSERGLVARIGGDEFGILLHNSEALGAAAIGQQLRRAAGDLRPCGRAITLSVGVAAAAGHEAQPERLMRRADAQLYRAKETRNALAV